MAARRILLELGRMLERLSAIPSLRSLLRSFEPPVGEQQTPPV